MNILIEGPIFSISGYGERSRKFITSLCKLHPVIYFRPIQWGKTINNHFELPANAILAPDDLKASETVFIQIGMPNEFSNPGYKVAVGITAGIETDTMPGDWYDPCQEMDVVYFSSNHSCRVYVDKLIYQEGGIDNSELLHEEIPNWDWNTIGILDTNLKNDFYFLNVGNWLNGTYKHDRKNIPYSIEVFMLAFKDYDTPPGLILKTELGTYCEAERVELTRMLKNVVDSVKSRHNITTNFEIQLVHGILSQEELGRLYGQAKAFYSLTHGEGFGRPIAEFAQSGKPVIVPNYSGYLDFKQPNWYLIDGEMEFVDETVVNRYIIKDSRWFNPDVNSTIIGLQNIFNKYNEYVTNPIELKLKNNMKEFYANLCMLYRAKS